MIQKQWLKALLPHVIAILIFLSVAVIYCRSAFQGKVLVQEDVSQWKAMAQNSFQYKDEHGHFPLWSEGMFSGMPAYQIAMDGRVISPQYYFYDVLTLWLKKPPASFFFLACVCFYFLTQVLRVSPYVGTAAALAYAYATYNAVIVAVGHDTKMQAIALLPAFIGSLILIYEKKYWRGAALTGLSTALFVSAQHPQIVYYGLIIAVFMTAGYAIRWVRQKDFRHLLIAGVLVFSCGVVGVLCNAMISFTTYDYAKATIRGGSELAVAGGCARYGTGLASQDYAFSYSMYKSEPFYAAGSEDVRWQRQVPLNCPKINQRRSRPCRICPRSWDNTCSNISLTIGEGSGKQREGRLMRGRSSFFLRWRASLCWTTNINGGYWAPVR